MGTARPVKQGWGFGPFSVLMLSAAERVGYGVFRRYRAIGGLVDIASRLIVLLLGLALLALHDDAPAFGGVAKRTYKEYSLTCPGGSGAKGRGESPAAALTNCDGIIRGDGFTANAGGCTFIERTNWVLTFVSESATEWVWNARTVPGRTGQTPAGCDPGLPSPPRDYGNATGNITVITDCPSGATEAGTAGGCECGLGTKPVNGVCKPYQCPAANSYSAITQPDITVASVGQQCMGGCFVTPASTKVAADGSLYATWPFYYSGKACGGSAGTDGTTTGETKVGDPPIACGTQQCPGQVNGQTICVPCSKQTAEGPSSSSSAPSQGASGPASGTSSSSNTECNGVTCTTTTTTRDGDGNVIGSTSKTEQQGNFCKDNPGSPLCVKSSFGGQCAATTCQGDAVQCAIAADQYRRNCQWFDDPAAATLADAGVANMTGQAQPDGHPGRNATETPIAFSSSIDQSDALGGGSCPTDVAVSIDVPLVGARQLDIGLSKVCAPLQIVGQLGVAITLLWAAVFVFRGGA